MIVFFLYLYLRRRQVDENMGGFVGIRAFVAMIYWRQRLTFRFRNFSVLKLLLISWGFWFQFRRIWSRKKVLVSVSKNFVSEKKSRFRIGIEKSLGIGFGQNFGIVIQWLAVEVCGYPHVGDIFRILIWWWWWWGWWTIIDGDDISVVEVCGHPPSSTTGTTSSGSIFTP